MTPCLRPEEFVDLVEGTLAPERRHHADDCTSCRTTAGEVREALQLATSVDVPEPAALFWPSINARVRARLDETSPARTWRRWLQWQIVAPLAGVAVVLVALAASVERTAPGGSRPGPAGDPPPPMDLAALDAAVAPAQMDPAARAEGEAALSLVAELSRDLPDGGWDTLGMSTLPDLAVAAAVLSNEEQEALADLLRTAVDRPKS